MVWDVGPARASAGREVSADFLLGVLDAMTEGVVETNPDGRLLFANLAYARMLGYDDVEDLLSRVQNVSELYAEPGERPSRLAEVEVAGEHVVVVELLRRDGGTLWVRARAVAHRDADGRVTSYGGVLEDVTEQLETERRLAAEQERVRLAFDCNPVPLAVLGARADGSQGLVSVNEAAEQLFGFPPGEILRANPADTIPPELVDEERALLAQLLGEAAGAVVELETRRRRADGSFFPVRIRASTFTGAEGATFTVSALEDLTEQRAAEAAVRELARQRQRLLGELLSVETEERGRIAADVHDHLIQLLVSASLRLQIALEQDSVEGVAPAVDAIDEAVRQLRNLLQHLEPDVGGGSLPGAVRFAADQFFEGTGVEVQVNGSVGELPHAVAVTLLHCAREALINARRHAEASHVEVRLHSGGGWHEMTVTDDGIGFGEDDGELTGHRGLRGVRARVGALNGTLSIERLPSGGTTVAIRVPVVAPREDWQATDGTPTGRVIRAGT